MSVLVLVEHDGATIKREVAADEARPTALPPVPRAVQN